VRCFSENHRAGHTALLVYGLPLVMDHMSSGSVSLPAATTAGVSPTVSGPVRRSPMARRPSRSRQDQPTWRARSGDGPTYHVVNQGTVTWGAEAGGTSGRRMFRVPGRPTGPTEAGCLASTGTRGRLQRMERNVSRIRATPVNWTLGTSRVVGTEAKTTERVLQHMRVAR
jgi:hypothetical protein